MFKTKKAHSSAVKHAIDMAEKIISKYPINKLVVVTDFKGIPLDIQILLRIMAVKIDSLEKRVRMNDDIINTIIKDSPAKANINLDDTISMTAEELDSFIESQLSECRTCESKDCLMKNNPILER